MGKWWSRTMNFDIFEIWKLHKVNGGRKVRGADLLLDQLHIFGSHLSPEFVTYSIRGLELTGKKRTSYTFIIYSAVKILS